MSLLRHDNSFALDVNKNHSFKKDVVDLFLGLKSAHLSAHTFGYAGNLWEDFFNTPSDYYVVRDEIKLISDNLRTIRKICAGTDHILDLGPGSEGAVAQKTLPIFNSFMGLKDYTAVDVSLAYLESAAGVLSVQREDVNFDLVNANFFDSLDIKNSPDTLALLFGLTLSNMPGIVDRKSGIRYLKDELQTFRNLLPKGSYFLCSFDTCQNEEKMMRAYNHPKHGVFIQSIAKKISEEAVSSGGFDKDEWLYSPEWDQENGMFRHVLSAQTEMSFNIDRHAFHIAKGHKIVSYMSVKFEEDVYMGMFDQTGFELATDLFKGPDGDVCIALLRAV